MLFEPTQRRVFAFNGGSHDATVIDAATNSVITKLQLPGRPEFSVTDGAGNVFVNIEDSSVVLRLDAATLKTTASWPLAPGETPSGLVIDIAGHRLFSVCDNNKMIILDSQTGKLIASPAIGEGADAVAFDAAHQLVFSSNGESGNMTVVNAVALSGYSTIQTLSTKLGARTMAVDPSPVRYTPSLPHWVPSPQPPHPIPSGGPPSSPTALSGSFIRADSAVDGPILRQ